VKLEINYFEDFFVFLLASWFFGLIKVRFYPFARSLVFSVFDQVLFRKIMSAGRKGKKRKKKKRMRKWLLNPEFIKEAARKILHDLSPRFHIFLKTGFETPVLTGLLLPASPVLIKSSRGSFELYPDFSSDILILISYLKIRILIIQLLFTGLQLFLQKRRIKNG
jgi:hypothetical protein